MDPSRAAEVWSRLIGGRSLDDLNLPMVGNRFDLHGIVAPEPSTVRQFTTTTANVRELGKLIVMQGVTWRNISFTRARLKSLRFIDSRIDNCCFEGADCSDWRMWGTTISDTSFRSADLRGAALGGVDGLKRNEFRRVDFSAADLRETANKSAEMVGCKFSNTNLAKVDFEGTVFVDCVFEGKLKEVQFHRHAFRGELLPPNEMKGVDFRKAKFHFVEFRGLDMTEVHWPEDRDHYVVHDFAATLDRLLAVWQSRSDSRSKRLAASFAIVRKWLGPNQEVGVVSKADLVEAGGEDAVAEFLRLVGRRE
jgi:uncharacterized protein YjbI with pentapeptide repeats